jgi:hypothetical protein
MKNQKVDGRVIAETAGKAANGEARVPPLAPPYEPEVEAMLLKWMPPGFGVEPLKLFRTILRHPLLGDRMRPLGGALLGKTSLGLRARELLILRTCARCGAEYEWGVHVSAFAAAAGLDDEAIAATTAPRANGAIEASDGDALLLRFADEMHDTSTVSDATWSALAARWSEAQLLEMIAVCGYYHLISYFTNAARIEREAWAARFPARGA